MGRRALRKIDPAIDLSRHLLELETLQEDWRPDDAFDQLRPLEVEVGSGKGLFLETATADRPDHNFLGVEVAAKYARSCAARLARRGRTNGVAVHGDALLLMNRYVPDGALAAVHVYFPDPWWKKRHRKRRVMNDRLLTDVVRTLRPGGELHFWTDVEEYFLESMTLLAQYPQLEPTGAVPESPAEHHLDYRTHFERRTRLAELPVYRAKFARNDAPRVTGGATST
ncbi:tRNA (guanine-N(7)-)-methyltransferase [Pirellulimonas nuda]|uniref:tRNA (guanine-N(7)-)-methyltransferase n=1 Tax=Pirellulimonas nuda TaxID=2528009 RepID=A0A518D9D6_9BACT|nr:tRNA (guanosine(46)-N7)-methyltransferase TrmB [Pirellulimonas nuda]QDU88102.1 tRNA (guanine-N(7)-)-methyltransferase [Pirellulimonas nuda]